MPTMFVFRRYIRLLTNVLDWQQRNTENSIQVKCEDHFLSRHSVVTLNTHHSLRMRARLRRSYSILPSNSIPICDRNGNNLLMIAPNNHLPFRGMMYMDFRDGSNRSGSKKIKAEGEEKVKEEDKQVDTATKE